MNDEHDIEHDIALRAVEAPDKIALSHAGRFLSRRALSCRVEALARRLRAHGARLETVVGIFLPRGPDMVVAMLATARAGAAWVPIDPDFPPRRIRHMLEDSGAALLLTREPEDSLPTLPEGCQAIDLGPPAAGAPAAAPPRPPDRLAYIMYTSGSTGRPKGVEVSHRALHTFLAAAAARLPITADDVIAAITTISFDIAVLELFLALRVGARVDIADRATAMDPQRLDALLRRSRVTVLQATPTTWRLLLAADRPPDPRICRLSGGEALTRDLARRLTADGAALWNLYGPTEATVWALTRRLDATSLPETDPMPLGETLDGYRARISEHGELLLGGEALARGYRGRPRRTAERFVPDPDAHAIPGTRLYRTGDLVEKRRVPGGDVERDELVFLGRDDRQVKIRGVRIEPGEIEAALRRHPRIADAAVTAVRPRRARLPESEPRLVAFVVPHRGTSPGHPVKDGQTAAPAPDEWRAVWDDIYTEEKPSGADHFNVVGWFSSYTGEPLPRAAVRSWVEHTISGLRALCPERPRVLEIGCGTGMLMRRLAPECLEYVGTDISATALTKLSEQIAHLPQARCLQAPAHELEELPRRHFDLVVINSVAQYFPDADYLRTVLRCSVEATKENGHIFVGDVRSLALLDVFCASVELFQANDDLPLELLRERQRQRRLLEDQLVLDVNFFHDLRDELPRLQTVRTLPKPGRERTEMTLFRYDVILQVSSRPPLSVQEKPAEIVWTSLERLRRELASSDLSRGLLVREIPDRRLFGDLHLRARLTGENGLSTVGALRDVLRQGEERGAETEDLKALARDLRLAVDFDGAGEGDGRFQAFFHHRAAPATAALVAGRAAGPGVANDPPWAARARRLLPELRHMLQQELPEALVPADLVPLDALPRLPNTKLDRAALRRRALAILHGRREGRPHVAPATAVQKTLIDIWAEVLGRRGLGIHDHFFELGGHSLDGTRALARVRKELGFALPLSALFAHPTVYELSAHLETHTPRRESEPPLVPREPGTEVPLSFNQEGQWYLQWLFERLTPDITAGNVRSRLDLRGPLDANALDNAFSALARRHEVLRTCWPAGEDGPAARVAREVRRTTYIDLTGLERVDQKRWVEALDARLKRLPFALDREPPWRACLLRLGAEEHVLLQTVHHMASDQWSEDIWFRELGILYRAARNRGSSGLRAPDVQYGDYALWQRQYFEEPAGRKLLAWWRARLHPAPPVLRLPSDRPRGGRLGRHAAEASFRLDASHLEALDRLRRDHDASRLHDDTRRLGAALEPLDGGARSRDRYPDGKSRAPGNRITHRVFRQHSRVAFRSAKAPPCRRSLSDRPRHGAGRARTPGDTFRKIGPGARARTSPRPASHLSGDAQSSAPSRG